MNATKWLAIALLGAAACGPSGRDGDDFGGGGSGSGSDTGSGGDGTEVFVYAHTSSALYRVDPDTLAIDKIGDFGWESGFDQMTDIAVDKTGQMLGVSFSAVYRIDTTTAETTRLSSSIGGTFNGLSFVPASQLNYPSGDDVLVGTRSTDGKVYSIDPTTGATHQVGDMGAYSSSGDLVAVDGFGTMQTIKGGSSDRLASLAVGNFGATPVGDTGYGEIWGVAFWKSQIYGFTNAGQFILIDPTTGAGTLVTSTPGVEWWGAAVTTTAPVLQ